MVNRNEFNNKVKKLNKNFISNKDIDILLANLVEEDYYNSLLAFDFKKVGDSLKQTVKDTSNKIGNKFMNTQNKEITSNNFENFRLDVGQALGSISLCMRSKVTWTNISLNNRIREILKNINTKVKMDDLCKSTLFYYYVNNASFKDLVDRSKSEFNSKTFQQISNDSLINIYNKLKVIVNEITGKEETAVDPTKSSVNDSRNANDTGNSKNYGVTVTVESNKQKIDYDVLYRLLTREYWGGTVDINTDSFEPDLKQAIDEILNEQPLNIKSYVDELLKITNASDQLIRLFFNDYNKKYFKYLLPNLSNYSTTNLVKINDDFKSKYLPDRLDNQNINNSDDPLKAFTTIIKEVFVKEQLLIDTYNKVVEDRNNEEKFLNIVWSSCTDINYSPDSIANRMIEELELPSTNANMENNFDNINVGVADYNKKENKFNSILIPINDSRLENIIKSGNKFKNYPNNNNASFEIDNKNNIIKIKLFKGKAVYNFIFDKSTVSVRKHILPENLENIWIEGNPNNYEELKNKIISYIDQPPKKI